MIFATRISDETEKISRQDYQNNEKMMTQDYHNGFDHIKIGMGSFSCLILL